MPFGDYSGSYIGIDYNCGYDGCNTWPYYPNNSYNGPGGDVFNADGTPYVPNSGLEYFTPYGLKQKLDYVGDPSSYGVNWKLDYVGDPSSYGVRQKLDYVGDPSSYGVRQKLDYFTPEGLRTLPMPTAPVGPRTGGQTTGTGTGGGSTKGGETTKPPGQSPVPQLPGQQRQQPITRVPLQPRNPMIPVSNGNSATTAQRTSIPPILRPFVNPGAYNGQQTGNQYQMYPGSYTRPTPITQKIATSFQQEPILWIGGAALAFMALSGRDNGRHRD